MAAGAKGNLFASAVAPGGVDLVIYTDLVGAQYRPRGTTRRERYRRTKTRGGSR